MIERKIMLAYALKNAIFVSYETSHCENSFQEFSSVQLHCGGYHDRK